MYLLIQFENFKNFGIFGKIVEVFRDFTFS